ncbi:MAG TPA: hypothetical protein VMY76_14120 [Gemmatimonadales bacterium]|nr:hypothetical protein [Gemmatimonadales bacterium]
MLACLCTPSAVRAQLAPVGVPAGAVRVDLDGAIDIWDDRWRAGEREPLGADLSSPAFGSDLLPSLGDADARIGRITGLSGYRLNLGALTTDAQAEDSRLYFGAAVGLTRSITIFGRMPLVRVRVQTRFDLAATPTSDAGLNPGSAQQEPFFTEFDASLAALSARIAAGDFDSDPALRARAQSTLEAGGALRSDLFGLLSDPSTAAPFVPTATSTAGTAVAARVAELQATLAGDFGVGGFTSTPALPSEAVTTDALVTSFSDPSGPIASRPGDTKLTFRGDAEAGVALTLVDRWDRGEHRGGFRAAIEGLVRFPTGRVAQPDRLLTLGTGEGQTDVEARLTTDLGAGRWGLRAEGMYTRQLAGDYLARVAPPTQPLAPIDRLSAVTRDPGDVLSLAVRPFFRLAPTFAIQGSAMHWSRGEDAVTYLTPEDEIPGIDAGVLAENSKASATLLGLGITYSSPGRLRAGGTGLPIDASWSYERIVRTSGGIVPDRHAFRARFRAYFGLF